MNSAAVRFARALVFLAVFSGFALRLSAAPLSSARDAIRQMPPADRVLRDLTVTDPRETIIRQIGAFWQLQEIINSFAYWEHRYQRYTAEETQLLNAYSAAEYNATQAFLRSLPSDAEKRKFSNEDSKYRYSRSDRRFGAEGVPLFRLFFTPEFEAFFRRAVAEGDARALAARPGMLAPAASNPSSDSTDLQGQLASAANQIAAAIKAIDTNSSTNSSIATFSSEPAEEEPRPGRVSNNRGVEQYQAKDYKRAIESFETAIRLEADQPDYYKNLASAQSAIDEHAKAIVSLKAALRLAPNDAAAYNSLGNEYCANEQPEDAVPAYQQAVQRKPKIATYHFNLGDTYADFEDYEEAVPELREALRLQPEFPEAFKRLGDIYTALKQSDAAVAAYQQAVRLESGSALYHSKLAGAYLAAKDYAKAGAQAQEAVRLDPDEVDNYGLLGNAQYYLEHYAEAVAAYQQAVQRAPKTPVYLYCLACAQAKLGQWDAVAKTQGQLGPLSPEIASKLRGELANTAPVGAKQDRSVPELLKRASEAYQKGLALEKQKSTEGASVAYASAIDAYNTVLELDPNSFEALSGIGAVYYRQRSYARAVQAFGTALKLHPEDVHVLNNFALVLLATREDVAALEALRKAAALAPKDAFIVYNLGYTYYDMGQIDEALKIAANLETIDPTSAQELRQLIHPTTAPPASFSDPKIELVQIPAGSFMMGNDRGVDGVKPQHRVTFAHEFYLGKFEITQKQWQMVMGDNPSFFKTDGEDCPVEQVSWARAQEFIQRLNTLHNGYHYRFPTEAEWEYAARGGRTEYVWPDDDSGWNDHNSVTKTHPVGRKRANGYGLYDMAGNVCEWCEDIYHANYTGAPTDGSAWVDSPMRKFRVLRGGSFYMGVVAQTVDNRNKDSFFSVSRNNGLRVAAEKIVP